MVDEPQESTAAMFERTLHMNSGVASALVAADILSLEELAYVPISELREIEALDPSQIEVYRHQARQYLLSEALGGEEPPTGPWEDDDGTLPVVPENPLHPMAGGSCALIEDDERE